MFTEHFVVFLSSFHKFNMWGKRLGHWAVEVLHDGMLRLSFHLVLYGLNE